MTPHLPDILAKDLTVVFCGINPALSAAVAGNHFVSGSNRFWRVLHLAGFTPVQIRPEDDRTILKYGYGLTAAVDRPTRSAGELARAEFTRAAVGLERKIRRFSPRALAFLGKAAYAGMTRSEGVPWGRQGEPFAGVDTWVLPNPSGLNRAFTLQALVAAYREMRVALLGKGHSFDAEVG
ncbi:MAG TPA: G/U mismatch-specific DNA glycosylase [Steroidobacteraceae bacterium]